MHTLNFWYKLNLHRKKIASIFSIVFFLTVHSASGQKWKETNLPNYDSKFWHYGVALGVHTSSYKLKYSELFTKSPTLDSMHAILPKYSPGFKVGFLVNFRLSDFLDLRVVPVIGFYEYKIEYVYVDGFPGNQLENPTVESTTVEFPLLIKYKSKRRKNFRMYFVGGAKVAVEVKNKLEVDIEGEKLFTKSTDISIELGFGIDQYFKLFKFSPEIRFSLGIMNVLEPTLNKYSEGIESLHTNGISLFLHFE